MPPLPGTAPRWRCGAGACRCVRTPCSSRQPRGAGPRRSRPSPARPRGTPRRPSRRELPRRAPGPRCAGSPGGAALPAVVLGRAVGARDPERPAAEGSAQRLEGVGQEGQARSPPVRRIRCPGLVMTGQHPVREMPLGQLGGRHARHSFSARRSRAARRLRSARNPVARRSAARPRAHEARSR